MALGAAASQHSAYLGCWAGLESWWPGQKEMACGGCYCLGCCQGQVCKCVKCPWGVCSMLWLGNAGLVPCGAEGLSGSRPPHISWQGLLHLW